MSCVLRCTCGNTSTKTRVDAVVIHYLWEAPLGAQQRAAVLRELAVRRVRDHEQRGVLRPALVVRPRGVRVTEVPGYRGRKRT